MDEGDRTERYKALFEGEDPNSLDAQFRKIAGEGYEQTPPTMLAAFQGAYTQTQRATSHKTGLPLQEEEVDKICGQSLVESLTLDELIQVCIFAFVENYCPGGHSDLDEGDFQTFLRDVEWRLPDVIRDWDTSPPPPPPDATSAYADLVESDPEGVELVREKLFEFWPKLDYVLQQSQGANVGREYSADGRGYGPVYYVSRYMASTAFLATEGFEDKDSLAARMVQARFSGQFRFSCKAFVDWMDDPANAAAGSDAAQGAHEGNPPDYTSRFDRNALAIAAVLYSESHLKETGTVWHPNIHEFWDENCISPNLHRSAVPDATRNRDPDVYGEQARKPLTLRKPDDKLNDAVPCAGRLWPRGAARRVWPVARVWLLAAVARHRRRRRRPGAVPRGLYAGHGQDARL